MPVNVISALLKKFSSCADFQTELCSINTLHKGKFQVGATVHLGSYVFPLLLPRYKERYPNIEVLITESRSADLERALSHNELDIALMHTPFSQCGGRL